MFVKDLIALYSASVSQEVRSFDVDEMIFRQGAEVRGIFAVEAGQVKLERYTADGRAAIMHVARANECFAEASLFAKEYHCSAIATKPSRIILFRKDQVLRALGENSELAMRYIALLSSEVWSLRNRLELSKTLSARERILQHLIGALDPSSNELVLSGTLKDLSAELGLAHETLYRELRKLEDDGVVERRDGRIKIKLV